MKASRFSDAQKAFILKQGADGTPVADILRSPDAFELNRRDFVRGGSGEMRSQPSMILGGIGQLDGGHTCGLEGGPPPSRLSVVLSRRSHL
jgi:hypothetical protein